jgi:fused signal recognition particle receptor
MFKRGLNDQLWDELEETLISADTGVQTTLKILNDLKDRVRKESIKDPDIALAALKEDLISILEVDRGQGRIWHRNGQHEEWPKPAVILVVGVNGTGKTTSIGKLAHLPGAGQEGRPRRRRHLPRRRHRAAQAVGG